MRQQEITALLQSYGFEGLRLVDHKNGSSTYSFQGFSPALLRGLGTPSKTADGKVIVYIIPKIGKIGITNDKVRFIDLNREVDNQTSMSHLAPTKFTPAIERAFLQASVNPKLEVPFCKKLYDYLNREKFYGALPIPKFETSEKQAMKGARGVYYRGNNFTAGRLWMWSSMFNARLPFFLEVFLHEMCHLASWCISKETDNSHQGHHDTWKGWMVKVGLDPRRFDPTDSFEYKNNVERALEEKEHFEKLGPRSKPKDIDALVPIAHAGRNQPVAIVHHGRIFIGELDGRDFQGVRLVNKTHYVVHLLFRTPPSLFEVPQ